MNDESSFDVGYGAIAVAVAALIVYACALANGFALDDVVLIPSDPRVVAPHIGALITRTYWNDNTLALYRPLTSVSFALDWYVSKGSAAWFHFINIVWHSLASVLAYLLLTRFFKPAAALVGGLLFALHPVHVEAVANVVGRAEIIAATFFFAACLSWTSDDLSPLTRAWLAALCFLLAFFAKESSIVLPAVLLLLDAARGRIDRTYLRERWASYGILALAVVIALTIRFSIVGELGPARLDPALEVTHGVAQRIMTALQVWPDAMRLLLFPRTLLADYDPQTFMPLKEWTPQAVMGLTIVIAMVTVGIAALVKRRYVWALALLWYPLTILVVSNLFIPIGVLLAERTLYLPSFAVSIAAAALWSHSQIATHTYARALLVVIMLALAIRTVTRIPVWKSTDSVMVSVAKAKPQSFRGQWHLARMSRQRGHVNDLALKLWPYREGLVQEAAAYGAAKGSTAWAHDVALWGRQHWPRNVNFHHMVAAGAIDRGDTIAARRAVLEGLRMSPNDSILNQMWRAFGGGTSRP